MRRGGISRDDTVGARTRSRYEGQTREDQPARTEQKRRYVLLGFELRELRFIDNIIGTCRWGAFRSGDLVEGLVG